MIPRTKIPYIINGEKECVKLGETNKHNIFNNSYVKVGHMELVKLIKRLENQGIDTYTFIGNTRYDLEKLKHILQELEMEM